MVDQDHASERSSTETIGRPDPAQHEMGKVVADKQNKSRFGFGLNNGVEKVDEPSRPDGKHELQDYEAPEVLGYAYSSRKKWTILSVIFIVQCSMNFNASIYANGVDFLTEKFSISAQAARVGQMIFLVAYAFGCELWAPWSEELGRKPILQASLFLVNSESLTSGSGANEQSGKSFSRLPPTLVRLSSPDSSEVCPRPEARSRWAWASCHLSVRVNSADGCIVADMWHPEEQQFAVCFVVFSSVFGSVIGPLVGPFVQYNLSWYARLLYAR